jgi:RND family efflux transporter MFP subunit
MSSKAMKLEQVFLKAVLVISTAAVFLMACGQESEKITEEVARPVKMLKLDVAGVGEVLEYPGKVSPVQDAEMAFEVAGKIIEFPVDEGQAVKKGDVLARLDPRDFEANLGAKAAKERAAKATYERNKAVHKEGVISDQKLDVIRKNYLVAKAEADTGRKALEDAVLRAPFSGKVARKIKGDFKNVKAKEPVLILQDDSNLEILINMPESDAVRIRPGLSLDERRKRAELVKPVALITSIPDRTFPLQLRELATAADPVTRTYGVTFTFERPDDVTILPGMTAKVRLTIPKEGDLSGEFSIPSSAVRTDESGKAFVWIVDVSSMKVRRTPVELGELSGSSIEVLKGLKGGDTIAISGVHQLREGMSVRSFKD